MGPATFKVTTSQCWQIANTNKGVVGGSRMSSRRDGERESDRKIVRMGKVVVRIYHSDSFDETP